MINPIRPPIVVVLGHVDHGKTTLLDTIRKTTIATGEAGGITQRIGAYQVEIPKGKITFIDTPGHEAFSQMRSRGVTIADIAVLVVAANDGVMPQTEEAISIIKKANIPFIVALNKVDLPEADPEKVKGQLAKKEVLVEKYGGDVVVVPLSAKTGQGVTDLLDVILLLTEMKGITGKAEDPLSGVVIESKLDKHRGNLATILLTGGTIKTGQTFYAEAISCRVRAMHDSAGKIVTEALPSFPVEVMGWEKLPQIGGRISVTPGAAASEASRFQTKEFSLPPLETATKLRMILKADVAGSLEAIVASLPENCEIVDRGIGEISESDILLAKSTGSIIIGFCVKSSGSVTHLAMTEKVRIKNYTLIYELLEEVNEVVDLLNKPAEQEQLLGEAHVLAEFKSNDERVAGCKIASGRVARGDLIKIMRKTEEVGRGRVKSMKQGKSDAPKIEAGGECGIVFDKKLDFAIGDRIIAYRLHELLA